MDFPAWLFVGDNGIGIVVEDSTLKDATIRYMSKYSISKKGLQIIPISNIYYEFMPLKKKKSG